MTARSGHCRGGRFSVCWGAHLPTPRNALSFPAMRALKVLLLAAPVLLLGACATGAPPAQTAALDLRPAQGVEAPRTGASPFGLFLAGQAALNDGRADTASAYFGRADMVAGDASEIRQQAFTTAVLAGEITRASALAPTGPDAPPVAERLGRLVRAVEALATDHPKDGRTLLVEPLGPPVRRAGALLAPFLAAASGDTDASVAVSDIRNDRILDVFGKLGQAQMYERARRYDEAETNYKAVISAGLGTPLFPLDYGGFLERRRRWDDAVAVYDAALAQAPNDTEVRVARAPAAARKAPPPQLTLKQGAARAMVAAAAGAMTDRQGQLAQVYLQLALRLDPTREEASILLGDVLAGSDDPEAARVAYARIPAKSTSYISARTKLAWTYQSADDSETAIRLAEETLKAAPNDRLAVSTLADLLRANERYAESAAVLNPIIPEKPTAGDWRLLYMRGIALERSGRVADGEKDLVAAMALRPNDPEILNYLGYMWIDRGEHLDEAQKMIEKALLTNPRSGAMIDSLAWAYYRRGDFPMAVTKLEQAVELEPADPDVNDHLGDAYWRVGRRTEAEFQWRRVLSLEPTDKQKAEVEAKLANGLGPSGPAQRPTVAGR